MRSYLYPLLLALCLPLYGEDPVPTPIPVPPVAAKLTAPQEVSGTGVKSDPYLFSSQTRCIIELTGTTEGVIWDLEDGPSDTVVLSNRYASFSLFEDGTYQIIAHGQDVYAKVWLKIKSGTDPPIPDPKPDPDPKPIPIPGKLTAVFLKDEERLAQAPSAQVVVLTSDKIRKYLKTHCATGTNGTLPEYRVLNNNPDSDISQESPNMQKAYKTALQEMSAAPTKPIIWLAVSNGVTGYSGPLPSNEDETLLLLKKYGGE